KKDYAENYHPSLKDSRKEIPGLLTYGPDAPDCVKFGPDGIRYTLPAGYPRQRPGTGVITDFGVKGDFEITIGFEILAGPNGGFTNMPTDLRLVVVPDERVKPEEWHKASQNRAGLV